MMLPRWIPSAVLTALGALLWTVPAGLAAQQTGAIQGTVLDAETLRPLPAAQVQVLGTGVGGISNANGEFLLLNVPAGRQTVRVASIGYRTVDRAVTVPAGGTATLEISITPAAIGLDEIVVTGTAGQARRREVGNSVVQIDAREIETQPINDVSDVLQGRATGVTVLQNSGQVGVGNAIRLRGNNSVSQGNNPLIYVDGVRIHESGFAYSDEGGQSLGALSDINPNDIERIEVVKGPAATTLYGTEAAGGVIQIFTKRGAGSAAWTFQMDQGIHYMGWVGPDRSVNPTGLGMNVCNDDSLDPNFPADPTCPESGSWLKNGRVQRYNLSVRGGTDVLDYFLSTQIGDERGVIDVGSDAYDEPGISDWAIRGNFGFSPRSDLRIRFNNYYSRRDMTWIPDGNNAEGFLLNVMRGARGYTPDNQDGLVFGMKLDQAVDHIITGVGINWTPGSLSHRLNAGLDFTRSNYEEEHPWGFFRVPLGDREVDDDHRRKLTLDYAGSWSTGLLAGLSSQLSWGAQLYQDFRLRLDGFGSDFAGPGDKELHSAARTQVFETRRSIANGGFFLQEMLGWNDQLFVTVGLRVDGHSSFGREFGWAPYPKISAAYTVSDNAFYPESWGSLKLRAAYGESGKAPGVFDATRTWESISGDEGQPGVAPDNLGNPDLGPERTRELELGFEGSTLNGRVSFDYSYYDQNTFDALIPVQQIPSSGFTGRQLENVGEIENWGHEASLNLTPLRREAFTWDVGLRYSTNRSNVVSLGDLENIYLGWRNYAWVGEPLPSYCHDVVQNPDEVGVPPVFDTECQGTTYPTWTLGANTGFAIGERLTFDILGEAQGGHVLNAATAYQNVRRGVWPPCYDIQAKIAAGQTSELTAFERAKCDPDFVRYGMWTEPADFFRLRSVSLGYRIPDGWLPGQIAGATLRLQGRNLLTVTDFPDLDPEVSESGVDQIYRQGYYHLPPFRTFMLSMKVDF